ncbi:hypothetical protein LOAG_07113 [Loa loa]|uniref:Uncharacterized protein n=1 Tax=Loa loa TaxID=7209 RepID=A0A1S0TWP7_LOALO|nr:hypothetical protein LOAG_07113 [Loa loa]EFO21372.1 hypothetical protein LOAG_07113 [Loa loa]
MEFSVPSNYFRDMFTEDWNISITAFAKVSHTNERFYTQQFLRNDSIASSTNEEQFQISIANSFNKLLTGCEIRIDGTGLRFHNSPISCGISMYSIYPRSSSVIKITCMIAYQENDMIVDRARSIEAHNTLTITTSAVKRTNLIERKIVAVFNCDQIKNVRTYFIVN